MSKHTVTMKSLIDENARLKIRLHMLEVEIAEHWRKAGECHDRRSLWNDRRFMAGIALGWLLGYVVTSLALSM